jgi:hypothetical protein
LWPAAVLAAGYCFLDQQREQYKPARSSVKATSEDEADRTMKLIRIDRLLADYQELLAQAQK